MPVRYVPYQPVPVEGQAVLNNVTRTRRLLTYRGADGVERRIARGLPLYDVETVEVVNGDEDFGPEAGNLVLSGSCLAACAYLKDRGIEVDLVYIDPPFASGADYAKKIYLRRNPKAAEALAQAEAELDDEALAAFEEAMYADIWNKEAYLDWMFENLVAIKSVMSDTSSIYVHLDWKIGHYVKIMMDEIFGESNFVNEIVWWYYDKMPTGGTALDRQHDVIFHYRKGEDYVANPVYEERVNPDRTPEVRKKVDGRMVRVYDEEGRQVMGESNPVKRASDVWRITLINSQAEERTDYPTQKPKALLERIIEASSNEGMLVADFFGGSGTTARAAHNLGRRFVISDVGLNSLQTTRDTLRDAGAAFTVAEVRDGVALFRNPAQTMNRLAELIPGLTRGTHPAPWFGSFTDAKLGAVPVYLPDLKDTGSRVLDRPALNRLLVALPDLGDAVKKAVVYYVDVDDLDALRTFERENNPTAVEIEFRDLKEVLAEAVAEDHVEARVEEEGERFVVTIERFVSDRLLAAVAAFNEKRGLPRQASLYDGTEMAEREEAFRKAGGLTLSDEGLEGIEAVFADATAAEGAWHSDAEVRIDKKGYVIRDGEKTKERWDGTLTLVARPLRLKVRSVLGDETVIALPQAEDTGTP